MGSRPARAPAGQLIMTVEGFNLPGASCAPAGDEQHQNIHVGVQRKQEVVEQLPGDAASAKWQFEVTTKVNDDGDTDFGGPYVHGRRGERFVYLSWGNGEGDDFTMFRRAKLVFADCDPKVMRAALKSGALTVRVDMSDAKGNPRCARVRPPDATWSASTNP
jgi:Family of unknown function (DUF5990)